MARFVTASLASLLLATAVQAGAESGISDDRILIGQTVSITGQVAGSVKELNEGARAYIEQVNRTGGVHGRRIELITLDDRFDPALAAKNTDILVNKEGVFAMFLNRATPHTEAILPILKAGAVPLVAPSTGAAIFHDPPQRLLFNVRAKYQDEVLKAIEHFTTVGINRIGIAHVDDSFGRDSLEGFRRGMQAHLREGIAEIRFARVDPDIPGTISEILKADPHALIIVGSATTTKALIKGIRAAGNQMQIMTLSNNSSTAFVESMGRDGYGVIVSQVTPAPHLITTRLGQEFKAAASVTGATVSYAAMEGFVAAKLLVEGLRRSGRALTREGFIRALESIRKHDLGGLMVDYGPDDRTGSEFVELTMIGRDGRFVR